MTQQSGVSCPPPPPAVTWTCMTTLVQPFSGYMLSWLWWLLSHSLLGHQQACYRHGCGHLTRSPALPHAVPQVVPKHTGPVRTSTPLNAGGTSLTPTACPMQADGPFARPSCAKLALYKLAGPTNVASPPFCLYHTSRSAPAPTFFYEWALCSSHLYKCAEHASLLCRRLPLHTEEGLPPKPTAPNHQDQSCKRCGVQITNAMR